MSADEKANVQCFWNAIVIAVVLYYLGSGFGMSLIVAFGALISTLIGYGRRYLVRGGFAMMIVGIAVAIHLLPPPDQWMAVLKSAQMMVSR